MNTTGDTTLTDLMDNFDLSQLISMAPFPSMDMVSMVPFVERFLPEEITNKTAEIVDRLEEGKPISGMLIEVIKMVGGKI